MSERVKWIEHKRKKILYLDYNSLKEDELVKISKEADQIVNDITETGILILINLSNSFMNIEATEIQKQTAKTAASKQKKVAIVGLNAMKKIILNSINALTKMNQKAYDSIDEAKDWLASE